MISSCGCKICKAGLGEYANQLVSDGLSLNQALIELENRGTKTAERTLKRHLSAFSVEIVHVIDDDIELTPVDVNLNDIDFSEYNFDINDIYSFGSYLQKINTKIFLNQSKITLQAQQDAISGKSSGVPKEVIQNQLLAYQLFERSSGWNLHVDKSAAIQSIQKIGLEIQETKYVELPPDSQTTE